MTSVGLRMRCTAFNTTNQGAVAKLLQNFPAETCD